MRAPVSVGNVNSAHWLYRWWDSDGVLLYLGVTSEPATRVTRHRRGSWWVSFADRVEIEALPCSSQRVQALGIEAGATSLEAPVFDEAPGSPPAQREGRIRSYLDAAGYAPPVVGLPDGECGTDALAQLVATSQCTRPSKYLSVPDSGLDAIEYALYCGMSVYSMASITRETQPTIRYRHARAVRRRYPVSETARASAMDASRNFIGSQRKARQAILATKDQTEVKS